MCKNSLDMDEDNVKKPEINVQRISVTPSYKPNPSCFSYCQTNSLQPTSFSNSSLKNCEIKAPSGVSIIDCADIRDKETRANSYCTSNIIVVHKTTAVKEKNNSAADEQIVQNETNDKTNNYDNLSISASRETENESLKSMSIMKSPESNIMEFPGETSTDRTDIKPHLNKHMNSKYALTAGIQTENCNNKEDENYCNSVQHKKKEMNDIIKKLNVSYPHQEKTTNFEGVAADSKIDIHKLLPLESNVDDNLSIRMNSDELLNEKRASIVSFDKIKEIVRGTKVTFKKKIIEKDSQAEIDAFEGVGKVPIQRVHPGVGKPHYRESRSPFQRLFHPPKDASYTEDSDTFSFLNIPKADNEEGLQVHIGEEKSENILEEKVQAVMKMFHSNFFEFYVSNQYSMVPCYIGITILKLLNIIIEQIIKATLGEVHYEKASRVFLVLGILFCVEIIIFIVVILKNTVFTRKAIQSSLFRHSCPIILFAFDLLTVIFCLHYYGSLKSTTDEFKPIPDNGWCVPTVFLNIVLLPCAVVTSSLLSVLVFAAHIMYVSLSVVHMESFDRFSKVSPPETFS